MLNVDDIISPEIYYQNGETSTISIKEMPYFSMKQYDLSDEKSYAKYIKDLESMVRRSFELTTLISFLKDDCAMCEDPFMDNVSSQDTKIKIEMHHSPLTLYDICTAVVRKRQDKDESLDLPSVAEEVAYLHYIGWVGLVPLSKTTHEMVHNNYLFIPTDIVAGNYNAFINAYYNYIAPEVLDAVNAAEEATLQNKIAQEQMGYFNIHQMYINVNGDNGLEQIPQYTDTIKGRINEIKNGKKIMCEIIREVNY